MKNWISFIVLVICTVTLSNAQSAFVKFEGIEGESLDNDHKGWSDIASLSQGIVKPPMSGATGTARRRASVILEDITCTKELDKSSPKLAEAAIKGKVFPKVEIHLTRNLPRTGKTTYYAYELKNVQVTSYQVNASGDDRPIDEFALNFEEIKVTYTEFDQEGRKKGNIEYNWKVEKGK